MSSSLTVRSQGDILFVALDSPDSTVNIMTQACALEIGELFSTLSPDKTRLVVFWSRKPYSFLNGAELILTNYITTQETLQHYTHETRAVYETVARSPIPTVAVIEGNCFGCGLEFALCCSYRIASDSYDTKFYMTELKDYHCLPVFGGLDRLTRLIGMKGAVDLLIGGEVWSADQAKAVGLVDEVLDAEHFWEELPRSLDKLAVKGMYKRIPPAMTQRSWVENTLTQIEALPPPRQPLYRQCLDLLMGKQNDLFCPVPKSAAAFFFTRTMCKVASLGTSSTIPDVEVEVCLNTEGMESEFGKLLRERKLKGLKIRLEPRQSDSVVLQNGRESERIPLTVIWGSGNSTCPADKPLLYFPFKESNDLCEVRISDKMPHLLKSFLILLPHLGWTPLVVIGKQESPIDRFLRTYLESVDLFVVRGGNMADLDYTLWSFGFEVFPHHIMQKVHGSATLDELEKPDAGQDIPEILDDLFIPLYREGQRQLKEGLLKHTSQVDLIMHSVFGYPLIQEGFCRFMEKKHKDIREEKIWERQAIKQVALAEKRKEWIEQQS